MLEITRLLWQACRVLLHLLLGLATATILLPRQTLEQRNASIQRWSTKLLNILRIQLDVSGSTLSGLRPTMIVANHVSWLDVYAINCIYPASFVAKSEVRHWPLIGWFARHAGTVFIDRARPRDLLKVNAQIAQLLASGQRVAVFPEGTTSPGNSVLPFHAPLLQPAIHSQAQLQIVAIRYTRSDGSLCSEADFAGDKTLLDSLRLIFTQPVIHAQLHFFSPLESVAQHRRDLAKKSQQLIGHAIAHPNPVASFATSTLEPEVVTVT